MFSVCSCLGQNGENLRQVATIGLETRKRRTDRRYDIFFITPFVRNLQRPGTAKEYQLYRLRYLRAAAIKNHRLNSSPYPSFTFPWLQQQRERNAKTFHRMITPRDFALKFTVSEFYHRLWIVLTSCHEISSYARGVNWQLTITKADSTYNDVKKFFIGYIFHFVSQTRYFEEFKQYCYVTVLIATACHTLVLLCNSVCCYCLPYPYVR